MSTVMKIKKTRNRKPKKPEFSLPPRGDKCIEWLPIAKREIHKRVRELGAHRLQVVEIAITNATKHLFMFLELDADSLTVHLTLRLPQGSILDALDAEWDTKLLSGWSGPKLKSNSWQTKLWEGKNGYWKLCKNWADQNKYTVSHVFWCKVFQFVHEYCTAIVSKLEHLPQHQLFLECLKYTCLYAIFASKIGFPKTRLLPLLVNTVIAKNGKVKKYVRQNFDHGLEIIKWKEEESDKYESVNSSSTDNKICAAVKRRCVQHMAQQMTQSVYSVYRVLHSDATPPNLNLDEFVVSVQFDAKGNITKNRAKKEENTHQSDSDHDEDAPPISNQANSMQIDNNIQQPPVVQENNANHSTATVPESTSMSMAFPPMIQPQPQPQPMRMPQRSERMNPNHDYNRYIINGQQSNPVMTSANRPTFSFSYSGLRGQSNSVRYQRANPLRSMTHVPYATNNNHQLCNVSQNFVPKRNPPSTGMFAMSHHVQPGQATYDSLLARAQRQNHMLRAQIAHCRQMLDRMTQSQPLPPPQPQPQYATSSMVPFRNYVAPQYGNPNLPPNHNANINLPATQINHVAPYHQPPIQIQSQQPPQLAPPQQPQYSQPAVKFDSNRSFNASFCESWASSSDSENGNNRNKKKCDDSRFADSGDPNQLPLAHNNSNNSSSSRSSSSTACSSNSINSSLPSFSCTFNDVNHNFNFNLNDQQDANTTNEISDVQSIMPSNHLLNSRESTPMIGSFPFMNNMDTSSVCNQSQFELNRSTIPFPTQFHDASNVHDIF